MYITLHLACETVKIKHSEFFIQLQTLTEVNNPLKNVRKPGHSEYERHISIWLHRKYSRIRVNSEECIFRLTGHLYSRGLVEIVRKSTLQSENIKIRKKLCPKDFTVFSLNPVSAGQAEPYICIDYEMIIQRFKD